MLRSEESGREMAGTSPVFIFSVGRFRGVFLLFWLFSPSASSSDVKKAYQKEGQDTRIVGQRAIKGSEYVNSEYKADLDSSYPV